jgi:membrane protease YdiL (CAAX protease family)
MKYFKMALWVVLYLSLYLILAVFVSLIITVIFLGFSAVRYGLDESVLNNALKVAVTQTNTSIIITNILMMGIITAIINARKNNITDFLWLRKTNKRFIAPVLLTGVTASLIVPAIMYALTKLFSLQSYMDQYDKMMESLQAGNPIINAIAIVIAAPLLEEYMFRGAVYKELRHNLPIWAAIIIQAALFGAFHMNLIQGIYAFGLGVILGLICEWTKSIWMSMLLHASFNAVGMAQDYLPLNNDIIYLVIISISIVALIGSVYYTKHIQRRQYI